MTLKLRCAMNRLSSLAMLMIVATAAMAAAPASDPTPPDRQRDFRFTYHSEISVPSGANHVEAWIPLPREDEFQRVTSLEVELPFIMRSSNRITTATASSISMPRRRSPRRFR